MENDESNNLENAAWISDCNKIRALDLEAFAMGDIAEYYKLKWPHARKSEPISIYLNMSLPDLNKLERYGQRKKTTIRRALNEQMR